MTLNRVRKFLGESTVLLNRFKLDTRGNIALMFGVAAVPVIMAGGMAVDFMRALDKKADLQAALDGAALAAVVADVDSDSEREAVALAYISANFSSTIDNPSVAVDGSTVTVTANTVVNTGMMSIVGQDHISPTGSAVATRDQGSPVCFLTLDPTGASSIEMQGSATFSAPGCAVHANSDNDRGLDIHTSSPAVADAFCVVGGYTGRSYSPAPRGGCRKVNDPFADLPWPAFTGCLENNLQVKSETTTLHPGTYCGGLDIFNSSNVTFAAGTYVIKDGPFKVRTHSEVHGNEVTFIFMGTNTSLFLQSGTTIDLEARQSGDYSGIVIAQHPSSNPGGESDIQGGSDMNIVGSIYLPTQKLDLGGGGDVNLISAHTPLVAYNVDVRGDNLNISLNGSLFPGDDNVPNTAEIARLVE